MIISYLFTIFAIHPTTKASGSSCFNCIKIIVYPGHSAVDGDTSFHFDYSDADEISPSESYFKRNRRIVDDSDFMLAAPFNQIQKGGTWYTINYSKKQGKGINVI